MKAKVNSIIPTQSFMSIPEVQLFLGIKSRKTILKYITSGKLSAYKVGGTRWRIAAPDVTAFLKAEFNKISEEKSEKSSVTQPFLSSPKTRKLSSPKFSVGDPDFTVDSRLKHAGMTGTVDSGMTKGTERLRRSVQAPLPSLRGAFFATKQSRVSKNGSPIKDFGDDKTSVKAGTPA